MRNVKSFVSPDPQAAGAHIQSWGLLIENCNRMTVSGCRIERAQHHGVGGNGYNFQVSRSNEILFADCVAATGRHNFIQNWDFGTTGCVWLRCRTSGGTNQLTLTSVSEYHHSLSMACLVDSCVLDDGWQGGNRRTESSGAGHSVTQSAYWNVTGSGYVGSWNYGWGYVIGTGPALGVRTESSALNYESGTEPIDFTEGIAEAASLHPQSIYDDQLARRLGRPTPTPPPTPTPGPSVTPGPTPTPEWGRAQGDFDDSGCTDIDDFLLMLDNWQFEYGGEVVSIYDFLHLVDNWLLGPSC